MSWGIGRRDYNILWIPTGFVVYTSSTQMSFVGILPKCDKGLSVQIDIDFKQTGIFTELELKMLDL